MCALSSLGAGAASSRSCVRLGALVLVTHFAFPLLRTFFGEGQTRSARAKA